MPEYRSTVETIFNSDTAEIDMHMNSMASEGWRLVSAVNDTTSQFYMFWERN